MKKYISEFIGTFALVFFGTGAIIVNELTKGTITHPGIAITFGLVIMSMIYALGDKSGAHLNPAVTLAFAANKNFPRRDILPYIISQFLGAISASLVLKFLFPLSALLGTTIPSGTDWQSFIIEMILTFFLMLVIIAVATGSKERGLFAGIAIGAVIGLEAMVAGPVSGASMNPARSLAPALISGELKQVWIYLVAPTLGALAAVFVNKLIK